MLSCIKYLVVFYNFLFWLLGVAILGLSAYLWWDSQNYLDLNEVGHLYITLFVGLLILGAVMTIVGFLGCCGAVRESSCLLATYFIFCVTMCVACGASLFWAIQNQEVARNRIKRDTTRLISQHYGQGNNNATEMLIDRIQRDLECCGATTPDDWINSNYNGGGIERGVTGSSFYKLPHSCCNTAILTNPQMCAAKVDNIPRHESPGSESIYKEGCLKKLEDWITNKWPWIVITGGILIGVQLFALIFACVLCCAISRVGDK